MEPQQTSEVKVFITEQLIEALGRIAFLNTVMDFNWRFRHEPVEVSLPNRGERRKGWLLWAEFERPDIHTGEIGWGRGRDEIIWEGTGESGVIKTAWVVVNMLVTHELMEGFTVDGKRPFNPHNTIQALNSLEPSPDNTYALRTS